MEIDRANNINSEIDKLEAEMFKSGNIIELPLVHRFTPNMYIREIFMPKGALVVSRVHKTEHPFTISKGSVLVRVNENEWMQYDAPYTGITKAGTRRVLYILEDCIWTTYHALDFITGEEQSMSDHEKNIVGEDLLKILTENRENTIFGADMRELYLNELKRKEIEL